MAIGDGLFRRPARRGHVLSSRVSRFARKLTGDDQSSGTFERPVDPSSHLTRRMVHQPSGSSNGERVRTKPIFGEPAVPEQRGKGEEGRREIAHGRAEGDRCAPAVDREH